MQKKYLLGILLVVVLAVAVGVALYVSVNNKYEKSIVRNTDTPEEENTLSVAENLNYTDIFLTDWKKWSQFQFSDYSMGAPLADFIDAVVIKYYDGRYESLKGKIMEAGFNYNANVSEWDKIHVVYVPSPENESLYAAKVRVLNSNGTILNEYGAMDTNNRFAWVGWNYFTSSMGWIDTWHPALSEFQKEYQASDIDFEFSNCYKVDMTVGYTEVHGNIGGIWCTINQTVIMDTSFKPLFIRVQAGMLQS